MWACNRQTREFEGAFLNIGKFVTSTLCASVHCECNWNHYWNQYLCRSCESQEHSIRISPQNARKSKVNSFNIMNDSGFAMIFSAIVLFAAAPTGWEFWRKVRRSDSDNLLKLELLKRGATADEIVRSLMTPCMRESSVDQG